MNSRFYFSTCQVGAEKALKDEVLRAQPTLRFAFSRPGFITFKDASEGGGKPILFEGVFARLWGEVLGQAKDQDGLHELVAQIPAHAVIQRFDRDLHIPGEEPPGFVRNAGILAACAGIPGAEHDGRPAVGAPVYSLIWVDEFHVFLGRHLHAEGMTESPGNFADIALPDHAPSRAYLKIEEAFLRFKPEIKPGIVVLEVGCAPGGASTAMLDRGFVVRGVDPQGMDDRVSARSGFRLVKKQARYLSEEDVRDLNPDWLVMDMGIKPREALDELAHVINTIRKVFGPALRLRQGFLTLKLSQWKFASEVPSYLARLEQLGFADIRPTQLCSNRQEFFVYSPRFK